MVTNNLGGPAHRAGFATRTRSFSLPYASGNAHGVGETSCAFGARPFGPGHPADDSGAENLQTPCNRNLIRYKFTPHVPPERSAGVLGKLDLSEGIGVSCVKDCIQNTSR